MRRLALVVAAVILAAGAAVAYAVTRGDTNDATTTHLLLPVADAAVSAAEPEANFGDSDELRVDGSPAVRSYLRFDLSEINDPIRGATLRVYTESEQPSGIMVYGFARFRDWAEDELTYAAAPQPPEVALGIANSAKSGRWLEFEVTQLAAGGDSVTLGLATAGETNVAIAAKEGGEAHAPRLVVDTGVGGTVPAPGASASTSTETVPSGPPAVIAAVGDIACDPETEDFNGGRGTEEHCRERNVARVIADANVDAVLTLGDTQYEENTPEQYAKSFARSWGFLKPLIRPAPGNHEYLTENATGYFQYFGAAAGDPDKGYYSYDLGAWHVLSLNSECSEVGGCEVGSPQETWLRRELATHQNQCVLAYWHHPRFSSGQHGNAEQMKWMWKTLVKAHVDVALTGHNHSYERFKPLDERGNPSPTGVQEFVVGTGGKNHYPFAYPPLPGLVVRNADTYGALIMTLRPTGYDWEFVPERGGSFSDSGSSDCR
jgi:calcineurin-like phosphoesterase family protein